METKIPEFHAEAQKNLTITLAVDRCDYFSAPPRLCVEKSKRGWPDF
jgi:hypothetical protein